MFWGGSGNVCVPKSRLFKVHWYRDVYIFFLGGKKRCQVRFKEICDTIKYVLFWKQSAWGRISEEMGLRRTEQQMWALLLSQHSEVRGGSGGQTTQIKLSGHWVQQNLAGHHWIKHWLKSPFLLMTWQVIQLTRKVQTIVKSLLQNQWMSEMRWLHPIRVVEGCFRLLNTGWKEWTITAWVRVMDCGIGCFICAVGVGSGNGSQMGFCWGCFAHCNAFDWTFTGFACPIENPILNKAII